MLGSKYRPRKINSAKRKKNSTPLSKKSRENSRDKIKKSGGAKLYNSPGKKLSG